MSNLERIWAAVSALHKSFQKAFLYFWGSNNCVVPIRVNRNCVKQGSFVIEANSTGILTLLSIITYSSTDHNFFLRPARFLNRVVVRPLSHKPGFRCSDLENLRNKQQIRFFSKTARDHISQKIVLELPKIN